MGRCTYARASRVAFEYNGDGVSEKCGAPYTSDANGNNKNDPLLEIHGVSQFRLTHGLTRNGRTRRVKTPG
jgi:hypothetical protein